MPSGACGTVPPVQLPARARSPPSHRCCPTWRHERSRPSSNAEQVSVKALQGDADAREVVDAVMSAEQSLQAAVAIRDKIVSAYLEISRMAI